VGSRLSDDASPRQQHLDWHSLAGQNRMRALASICRAGPAELITTPDPFLWYSP
jgi:hypothetical protein